VLFGSFVGALLVASTVPAFQRWVIGDWVKDIPRKWRGPGGVVVPRVDGNGVVRQSTGYTCAAAACATLLRDLGIDPEATEQEMVYLCRTKRRGGATTLGMATGLKAKLAGSPWQLRILEPDWGAFLQIRKPVVCSMEHADWLGHAVVVRGHDSKKGVLVADPLTGLGWWSEERFRDRFKDEAIVIFQGSVFK
jgi:predicted double-glycine peptidase